MESNLLKRVLRRGFNFVIAGRFFRLYAPQAAPAPPGGRHKLAISDLIPHLGDKVMIFPLLDALRRENPDLEISYFTSGAGSLIGSHPAVDHLYCIARKQAKNRRFLSPPFLFEVLQWWWRELRNLRFHTVVVLRGGVEPSFSHHLAWLLGGRARFAYSPKLEPEKWESQFGVSPLFTAEVTEMRGVHEVSRGNEVLQLAGLLKEQVDIRQPVQSVLTIAHSQAARTYLGQLGLSGRPYAVIAPGASLPRRAWSAADFGELARLELLPRGWLPVLVGGPETAMAAQVIQGHIRGGVLDLTGKTSFEQLVAVCGGAQCFLGNDSGTSHVAGACGVPTLIVTAFAHSGQPHHHASPKRSHPLGPWVAVVQPDNQLLPCTTECLADEVHCIGQVTVEEMGTALRKLLEKNVGQFKSRLHAKVGAGSE
ncbi:glycosyltransferase family 9 protein [Edaphobacter bradus]|uniref:glycosyltransferase family 9 protein n=1 Tax=Edaphobacter bradus TaxID=2259016 RepID=UPI0021E07835|nr:glycosyltransferase family 9 protein [Edaphobacter bradus]